MKDINLNELTSILGIGTEDSIEANSSSFMKEMKDVAFIIKTTSHKSLIVIGKENL
jgi:DNA mismatch repair ATPase MutS